LVNSFNITLEKALGLLGISAPNKMWFLGKFMPILSISVWLQ
jgi:hypothetical protein